MTALSPDQEEAVLKELEGMGLTREEVQNALSGGEYDYVAATYYLTASKASRRLSHEQSLPKPKTNALPELLKVTPSLRQSKSGEADKSKPPVSPNPMPAVRRASVGAKVKATAVEELKNILAEKGSTSASHDSTSTYSSEHESLNVPESVKTRSKSPGYNTPEPTIVEDEAYESSYEAPIPKLEPINPPPRPPSENTDRPVKSRQTRRLTLIPTHAHTEKDRETRKEESNIRFISPDVTSEKDTGSIMVEVLSVLHSNHIQTKVIESVMSCRKGELEFEIEICKIPGLSLNGLRFKRLGGSAWDYKDLISHLLSQMKL